MMELQITNKGALYAADCSRCGATHYCHELATYDSDSERDAMRDGTQRCNECGGAVDPKTFTHCGQQYAARYSAPGYLDCTDWHFGTNRRYLVREMRDFYEAAPGASP